MRKISFVVEGSKAKISIDNPQKRNVLSEDVMVDLKEAVQNVSQLGDKVKALIIYSKYPAFFSAGGDIKEWQSYGKELAYKKGLNGGLVFKELENLPVVTIAAISGSCLGGGNELALACDYRLVTEDASFGQPEIELGNGLSWGGYYRLVKTVGLPMAKEMILLGNTYTAAEALHVGLVNQVVGDWNDLMKTADEIADGVAVNANTAAISKHILNQIGDQLVPNSSLIDSFSAAYFAQTEDSKRRKQAFINKTLNEEIHEELKALQEEG